MADATSSVTLELHGFLADRLAGAGRRRGTRTLISAPLLRDETVRALLTRLATDEPALQLLFEPGADVLPEHVEVVLNDRLLDLQGGLQAQLKPGDVLTFLPAHAGGL